MKKSKKFFITGTDTDVGKTVISQAIISALVKRGLTVSVAKPVESGAVKTPSGLLPGDAQTLADAAGLSNNNLNKVCCYSFEEAVSPHLAAHNAGVEIKRNAILSLLKQRENESDVFIAEGAGGFMVPLGNGLLYADIMQSAGYPLVIVALNRLGTINATLLTIEAARKRGLEIRGVVLNKTPKKEWGNAEAIEKYGRVKIIGEFPTVQNLLSSAYSQNGVLKWNPNDSLADLADKYFNMELFYG
jgi:dethiobiotin synthetase